MTPRQRVLAALDHHPVDQIPRCEVWIDALFAEFGVDPVEAHPALGQDVIFLPWHAPPGSNAWGNGIDEWGRVWRDGIYAGGVVDTYGDLKQYTPTNDLAQELFSLVQITELKTRYPDHCRIFGSHIGPFMMAYMALGFERFFYRLYDDPRFVHAMIAARTDWCLAVFQQAVALGAEVLILGDDAAYGNGPMISPRLWREFVLPYHRQIVSAMPVPVIWHSDGYIQALLPMVLEAGFKGIHGLEPAAGMHLGKLRQQYAGRLSLIGNFDVRLLCGNNLHAVQAEVDRCLDEGGKQGGYLFSTCNSIFPGMQPDSVAEMLRYSATRLASDP